MRFDQFDPVAERILHMPALAAFDGLVFILDPTTGGGRDKSVSPRFRKALLCNCFLRAGRSGACRACHFHQRI
jgi:hypothetical protein